MHRDPDALRREAVSEWMDLYGDQVMRLCFTALRDHHLAQDACQETFFRAWKYFDRFRFESSGRTWLMRIIIASAVVTGAYAVLFIHACPAALLACGLGVIWGTGTLLVLRHRLMLRM